MDDSVIVDTDVASYIFKNNPRAKSFRPHLIGKQAAIAFLSVAELFKWTLKRRWGSKKTEEPNGHCRAT
jgi:tRNA(fMet)-specific endonuclease VapC